MIGDALSRKLPEACEPRIDDVELSDDITLHVEAIQQNWPKTEDSLTKITVDRSSNEIERTLHSNRMA